MYDIKVLRNLFSSYSPLKSNESLRKSFVDITYDYVEENENIRKLYNDLIFNNYLNETVIKSSFIKSIASKRSPSKTITIFELNSSDSRADICMVNGHSEVFEIKTSYDTFYRLDKQLEDYYALYDLVNIIVPIDKVSEVSSLVPNTTGILSYRKNRLGNISFTIERSPIINNSINPIKQLEQFTKNELLRLINQPGNYKLSKDHIISTVMSLLTPDNINHSFKEYIKTKYREQWLFLYNNYENIHMIDYQWFFKNNVSYKLVYR
ncbi:MAG: sce7726 family protein [Acholeplasma sp.]|nr:sce7726 family protein [Acholeplasma sp.]